MSPHTRARQRSTPKRAVSETRLASAAAAAAALTCVATTTSEEKEEQHQQQQQQQHPQLQSPPKQQHISHGRSDDYENNEGNNEFNSNHSSSSSSTSWAIWKTKNSFISQLHHNHKQLYPPQHLPQPPPQMQHQISGGGEFNNNNSISSFNSNNSSMNNNNNRKTATAYASTSRRSRIKYNFSTSLSFLGGAFGAVVLAWMCRDYYWLENNNSYYSFYNGDKMRMMDPFILHHILNPHNKPHGNFLRGSGSRFPASLYSYGQNQQQQQSSSSSSYLPAATIEPYKSFQCLPRGIHIAQRTNIVILQRNNNNNQNGYENLSSLFPAATAVVDAKNNEGGDDDDDDNVENTELDNFREDYFMKFGGPSIGMTVSFSLDYQHCSPQQARPFVVYGRHGKNVEGVASDKKQKKKRTNNFNDSSNYERGLVRQYNYTSRKSNGLYQSDWIYHVELPQLQAGREEYWYRVVVLDATWDDSDVDEEEPSLLLDSTAGSRVLTGTATATTDDKFAAAAPPDSVVLSDQERHLTATVTTTTKAAVADADKEDTPSLLSSPSLLTKATTALSSIQSTSRTPTMSYSSELQVQGLLLLGHTPTYTFFTPPLSGGMSPVSTTTTTTIDADSASLFAPTRIAFVGDLGQTENSTATAHNIYRAAEKSKLNPQPITHLLIVGDLSYADANPWKWNYWLDLMEPLFRSLPLHVAAGNHEIECDKVTGELFKAYENLFRNPNRLGTADQRPVLSKAQERAQNEAAGIAKHYLYPNYYNSNNNKYLLSGISCTSPSEFLAHYDYGNAFYSYQHGLATIFVLSSYSNSTVGSPQYAWLEKELQAVDRTVTPWVIVAFHAPAYTTVLGHEYEMQSMQMKDAMERPLWIQYGVNLVISGHDHAYMRTHPILEDAEIDPEGKAPVYLTLGAGGNHEQHSRGYIHKRKPERWVAARSLVDYGYGYLSLENATHAFFSWVRDHVEEEDYKHGNAIHDAVWFLNGHAAAATDAAADAVEDADIKEDDGMRNVDDKTSADR